MAVGGTYSTSFPSFDGTGGRGLLKLEKSPIIMQHKNALGVATTRPQLPTMDGRKRSGNKRTTTAGSLTSTIADPYPILLHEVTERMSSNPSPCLRQLQWPPPPSPPDAYRTDKLGIWV